MAQFHKPLRAEIKKIFKDVDTEDPDLETKFKERIQALFDKYPEIWDSMDSSMFEKQMSGAILASMAQGYIAKPA